MAFPTLAPDRTQTMHPLMAWWTVLYALSMLTRLLAIRLDEAGRHRPIAACHRDRVRSRPSR